MAKCHRYLDESIMTEGVPYAADSNRGDGESRLIYVSTDQFAQTIKTYQSRAYSAESKPIAFS